QVASAPAHAWMRWRSMHPQDECPSAGLVHENGRRGKLDREFELLDTGIFDSGRYWEITADYAKAGPEDILLRVTVRNAGPERATIDVLPTLWFRNTWSWGIDDRRPSIRVENGVLVAEHQALGVRRLVPTGSPEALFCENETDNERLFGVASSTQFPKDGINDHVVHGAATINPDQTGTKAAFRYRLEVEPGASATVELRLSESRRRGKSDFAAVMELREQEADELYAEVTPDGCTDDDAPVLRQAHSGMLCAEHCCHHAVRRLPDG